VSEARVSSEMQPVPLSPTLSFDPTDAHNASSCATTATTASNTANTGNAPSANYTRSIRQSKRLMQQILSLENKVPRSVRKWAVVARTCFSHGLVAEDRLVQEWVDKQRIQVVLACGGYNPRQQQHRLSFGEASSLAQSGGLVAQQASERENVAQGRSSSTPHTSTTPSTTTSSSATITSPSFLGSSLGRMSFAEGIRLGNNNHHGHGEMVSRPTSGVHGTDSRMSASQQMLSMHLWLSVLVSPLSPQQMVYDRFME
jgi:hypothetical protein